MAEPRYLLDSNICIYVLEGLSDTVRTRMEMCRPGELTTSAVAYAEVMRGISRQDSIARAKVDALFQVVSVLPFDAAAARAYDLVPFRRDRFDRLIAAHALALELTLVTNNEGDFLDAPGLRIENWTG